MKFLAKETTTEQSAKSRRLKAVRRAAKLSGKIDRLSARCERVDPELQVDVSATGSGPQVDASALRDLLEALESAAARLRKAAPEGTQTLTELSEIRKAKDGRIISAEVVTPVERFHAREVSRFCVRRYSAGNGVFVDVSRRAGDEDLRTLEALWKLVQSPPNANYVFVWKHLEPSEGQKPGNVRESISAVMISSSLRRQYRVLSALTVGWWESLSASCVADLIKPRTLLTAHIYRDLFPFSGWVVQRKKKNSVVGAVAYDFRTKTLSLLTDRGLHAQVADVQRKEFSKSFVLECDVVVETAQVTPVRLVKTNQMSRDNQQNASMSAVVDGVRSVFGDRVNILESDKVLVPSFQAGHHAQACKDLKTIAKLLVSDQALPAETQTEACMYGGAQIIREATACLREAALGKGSERRAEAIMAAAGEYEKRFIEKHKDPAAYVEGLVTGLAAKPQTAGVIFVSADGCQVLEWETLDTAEFEFVAFRREKNRYAITVAVSQDLVSEQGLNIPKAHCFVEEYFGKARVSAHKIPVRFRPFWRQTGGAEVDEIISEKDVDRKVIRAKWTDRGWQLVDIAKRQGLGMDIVAAETKWALLQSGSVGLGFWRVAPALPPSHIPHNQLDKIKQKFMAERFAENVVLDIGTASAKLYAGVGCDEVVFATNQKQVLENLARDRQAIVHELAQRDGDKQRYPRMSGFVCDQSDIARQAEIMYQKQINLVFCNMNLEFLELPASKLRETARLLHRETDRVCLVFIDGRSVHEEIFQRNAVKPGEFFAFKGDLGSVFTRLYTEETITEKHVVKLKVHQHQITLRLACPDFVKAKMEAAGFQLVEQGDFGARASLLESDVKMFARLHVFQVYKVQASK